MCVVGLVEVSILLSEDRDPKIRDTIAIFLSQITHIIKKRGNKANEALKLFNTLETLNNRIYKKIMTLLDSISSNNTAGTAGSGVASSTDTDELRPKTASEKIMTNSTKSVVGLKKPNVPTSTSSSMSSLPKKTSQTSTKSNSNTQTAVTIDDESIEDLIMSSDESIEILSALNIPNFTRSYDELYGSAKWQDKVEAIEILNNKVLEFIDSKLQNYKSNKLIVLIKLIG